MGEHETTGAGTGEVARARLVARARVSAGDVAVSVGFACLIATMIVYSAAAMPFQRFETLPGFVEVFGYALRAGAPAGAVAAVAAALGMGRVLASVPARLAGAVLYVAGNIGLCAMALLGAGGEAAQLAVGICMGVGCVMECLAWAHVMSRYNLRRATGVVAGSAVMAALLGWVQLLVPEVAAVALFLVATAGCVALPLVLGVGDVSRGDAAASEADGLDEQGLPYAVGDLRPGGGAPLSPLDDQGRPAAPFARLRAFLDVAFVPAVGLALFAMLMGVRGELFFEDYLQYVGVQVVVAALLLGCALAPVRVPLLRGVYRGLIPTLGVLVLACGYVGEALWGGSSYEILLVMVLYTAAALLTLSTLAGMAHAAEFSSDLIAGLAIGLFCFVTVLVQKLFSGAGADEEAVRAFIVISSGAYAAGMIVLAVWRGLRAEREADPVGALVAAGPAPASRSRVAVLARLTGGAFPAAPDALAQALAPSLDERCVELARTYALTAREREILGYLARGHTGVYIADELLISPNTARTHIHNIYRKLGAAGREDVLRLVRDAR